MKIENPFESGHIKNYILAYVGVVVIMVLFFFAATIWNEPREYQKKIFNKEDSMKKVKIEADGNADINPQTGIPGSYLLKSRKEK